MLKLHIYKIRGGGVRVERLQSSTLIEMKFNFSLVFEKYLHKSTQNYQKTKA